MPHWIETLPNGGQCFVENGATPPEGVEVLDDATFRAREFDARAEAAASLAAMVPTSCSKLGLKRALAETGSDAVFKKPEWPTVKELFAKNPDLQEDWDLAVTIRRTDLLVQGVIAERKYDDEIVDKILIRANVLAA